VYRYLIKAYDVLPSLFNYDIEDLIAQKWGCLLDSFDWEPNYIALCNMHWCSLVGDVPVCASRKTLRLIVLFTNSVTRSLQRC